MSRSSKKLAGTILASDRLLTTSALFLPPSVPSLDQGTRPVATLRTRLTTFTPTSWTACSRRARRPRQGVRLPLPTITQLSLLNQHLSQRILSNNRSQATMGGQCLLRRMQPTGRTHPRCPTTPLHPTGRPISQAHRFLPLLALLLRHRLLPLLRPTRLAFNGTL